MPKASVVHSFSGSFGQDVYYGDSLYERDIISLDGPYTFNDLINWFNSGNTIHIANNDTQMQYIIFPSPVNRYFCVGFNTTFWWGYVNTYANPNYVYFSQIQL